MAKVLWQLRHFRGYDIVQLINPMFLELRAEHILPVYRYLRRHNQHVVLGAFGMDYYWVNVCSTTMPLRYSDFNIGKTLRTGPDAVKERKDWIGTAKEKLNRFIANDCDAIVAGLYEYWVCYHPLFPMKTHFIPYPIVTEKSASSDEKGKKYRQRSISSSASVVSVQNIREQTSCCGLPKPCLPPTPTVCSCRWQREFPSTNM